MSIPCKIYFPRPGMTPKVLIARTQAELDALLRMGWKVQD